MWDSSTPGSARTTAMSDTAGVTPPSARSTIQDVSAISKRGLLLKEGHATVSIVQGKTVKNTLYLEEDALRAAGVWDVPGTSGFYAARVGCVSSDATGAATVTPTAVVKPLSPAEFMHEVYDRGSSGCSQEVPLGAWPCAGWKTPEGWAC